MLSSNLHRLSTARSRLVVQGKFLSNWKCDAVSAELNKAIDGVRASCPSLLVVTGNILSTRSPQDMGRFFAIVGKLSVALSVFLLHNPSSSQLEHYCADLESFMRFNYGHLKIHEIDLGELASSLQDLMQARRIARPHLAAAEAGLLPLEASDARTRAIALNSPITVQFLDAVLAAHFSVWWTCLSFGQFFQMSKGFADEYYAAFEPPYPELTSGRAFLTFRVQDAVEPLSRRIPPA